MPSSELKIGGIVLCGGRSSRMGQPKALLPVGHEVMLQRVVRTLSQVVSPIIVVAAADQELPTVNARIARDPVEYRGPLAGLAVGLRELRDQVDAVYLTACDVPLLSPQFVSAMIAQLGDAQIAVSKESRFHHPLAAVYRTSVLSQIEELLAADQLRPVFLFDRCQTREVPVEELRQVDPDLESLINANTPEEYARVLTRVAVHDRPLPPYTHTPGVTPHPISDPAGHMYGVSAHAEAVSSDRWLEGESYLWGRRLFQYGFYWEAHEAWEGLWNTLGRIGPNADLVKGLIKLAAAGVKLREGNVSGCDRHLIRASELFRLAEAALDDVDVKQHVSELIALTTRIAIQSMPNSAAQCGQPVRLLPRLPG